MINYIFEAHNQALRFVATYRAYDHHPLATACARTPGKGHHCCRICKLLFETKKEFDAHRVMKNWTCSKCGPVFTSGVSLKAHILGVHKSDRPHKWDLYSKALALQTSLVKRINFSVPGNPSHFILMLLSLSIDSLAEFYFLDAPPAEALLKSLEHLYGLGA